MLVSDLMVVFYGKVNFFLFIILGECLRDNLHGYGITYDETNAKCLRGFFENGEENGFGIQYLANNYVFERIPSGNSLKGKGKLISPDNNYFMGEFIGSVKNGYGEIHYDNGFSFKGYFANDKRVFFYFFLGWVGVYLFFLEWVWTDL